MQKINGFDITTHEKSKRIICIKIEDEILDKLIFPFNKFNVTALEYKPFTRFTLAKSLDDLTYSKLGKLMNSILNTGINKEIIIDKKLKSEVVANNSIVDINH